MKNQLIYYGEKQFGIMESEAWTHTGMFLILMAYAKKNSFNLLNTNRLFLLVWYNKLGVHCTYLGVSGYNLKKIILYSVYLKSFSTFKNSVDPDEMQHYAAFHLGLQCLQKYSFKGFPNTKD